MNRPTYPDLKNVKRVLIVRGSAIGDVIHASPLSAALKEAFPRLEITWIVEEICGDVLLGNPYLHDVIVIPRSRWKKGRLTSPRVWGEYLTFLRSLRARRFDVSLDLQGYAKSAILVLAAGATFRLGWWRQRDGANLVSRAIPRRPESVHRVDWFLDVARALGAEPQTVRFPLQIPDEARTYVETLLLTGGIDPTRPYAVLNQAAGDQARRWTEAGFAQVAWELARRYGMPSVLVGVESDRGPNAEISAQFRARKAQAASEDSAEGAENVPEPLDVAGKTNLKQLFALIDRCAIQISGDTGSLHIADALDRPLIGLFGSSDPAHAGPWRERANVIAHRDLCRPDCAVRRCAYWEEEGQTEKEIRRRGEEKNSIQNRPSTIGNHPSVMDSSFILHSSSLPAPSRCLAAITPDEVMDKVAALLGAVE